MKIINNHFFHKRIGTFPIMLMIVTLLFSSCVTHRNLEYLRVKGMNNKVIESFPEAKIPDYKLQINDELHIDIKSLDDPTTNVFQQTSAQVSGYTTPFSASLSSYMIDKLGYIQLPVLGNIHVEDKSIPEVISLLKDSLDQILSYPQVNVKLVNRYVSVLGEVRSPGHYIYAQEKLTIYDALGLAGDITSFGDRNDVVLTRNEDGKNKLIKIDLTSAEIMSAEYYYLRPNDMLYVKPMRKRFWGMPDGFPWTIFLGAITTGVLLYGVIN